VIRGSAGIIGGGIFGVAAALELRALGVDVTLYEKRSNILEGTTSRNFFRVHRGYHYPRSLPTARQALKGYAPFMGMFAEALTPAVSAYYAIAAEGSLTTAEQFLDHCDKLGLGRWPVSDLPDTPLVPGSCEACFEVDEYYYDPELLRRFAWERLQQFGVRVNLNWRRTAQAGRNHDVTVVAAHAATNEVLTALDCPPQELQYELCEVPILSTPQVRGLSLVVMDGPFCSIAPFGDGRHILYDVEHSVHRRAVAAGHPSWPGTGDTAWPVMLESAARFVDLGNPRYLGSLWADRVVLPGVDATDARPTKTWWASPTVLAVLSGKVSASVLAGRDIAAQVAARLCLPEAEQAGSKS
jgi:glycine/D-amino acid oxidase-like deaminating enzyme